MAEKKGLDLCVSIPDMNHYWDASGYTPSVSRLPSVAYQNSPALKRWAAIGCGEEGIRTPGTRKRTPVFEAGSFNHSDTSPLGLQIYD